MLTAQKLPTPPLTLGEGPVWHAKRRALFFVDIDGCALYGYRENEGIITQISMPDRVGFVAPWGMDLLAGVGDTLCHVAVEHSAVTRLYSLELEPGMRFNDGKCDPEGRLWAGVMAIDRSRPDAAAMGALYGIDKTGVFQTISPMDIPNGMAWGSEGRYYHTDTSTGRIDGYDRSLDGRITSRRGAVQVGKGAPDGFCMDAEGMLWVALWGAGKVQRYDPRTGCALAHSVQLPEAKVSCCCFGGQGLDTLYITTAHSGERPGGLYAVKPGVTGLKPHDWQGSERMTTL